MESVTEHAPDQREAGMIEGAGPRITGIHHVSATVTDVEASVAWYQRLFGMDRIPFTFRHYGQEEVFDECRTGLDHLSFGVPARDDLTAWVVRLDELGIQHTG